jgi:hypothetical protein
MTLITNFFESVKICEICGYNIRGYKIEKICADL